MEDNKREAEDNGTRLSERTGWRRRRMMGKVYLFCEKITNKQHYLFHSNEGEKGKKDKTMG